MVHSTFVVSHKREFLPGCSCHWNPLPVVSRQHANNWVQAHLHNAASTHLSPYVYTDKLDTAS